MSLFFAPAFFFIALLYSSVGFGGGSSYTAILSLAELDYTLIPLISLCCNIIVVSGSCWLAIRKRLLPWKQVLPLVTLSVPAAYFGGRLQLSPELFFGILGFALLLAGGLMLWNPQKNRETRSVQKSIRLSALLGVLLGFLSGLAGIGGGIFLAPLLYLIRWGKERHIASACSFFILLNSVSGLLGQMSKVDDGDFLERFTLWWLLPFAVLLGGQLGNRLSVRLFSPPILRRGTALLVLVAGVRILVKAGGAFR